jgi:hypothetical protein
VSYNSYQGTRDLPLELIPICTFWVLRVPIMSAKIETILQSLTLEEKISLLAGKDFWETVPIPGKGVPAIKVGYLSL